MLINNSQSSFIDIELKSGDSTFRFCNFFDLRSRNFEEEKIRSKESKHYIINDDEGQEKNLEWPSLSYWQSYHYLDYQNDPYYFLQMSNNKTNKHYQIAIISEVSKISYFKIGTIHKWIVDIDSLKNQEECMEKLIFFCKRYTGLMSLRIQPYMPGEKSLESIPEILSPLGFNQVKPKAYTKTRMIDLRPSVEEMLNSYSTNGRARLKIKDKDKEEAFVKEVSKLKEVPSLQKALNESYQRSSNQLCPYNFTPLFKSSAHFNKEVVVLGFYLKEAESPKAFITGISHKSVVEFSTGGSVGDANLRRFPFNHILMWQLALRSKINGCHFLDMGGISIDFSNDKLSGINNFKRLFPGFELTTGHEMQKILRPNLLLFYTCIQKFISKIKKGKK